MVNGFQIDDFLGAVYQAGGDPVKTLQEEFEKKRQAAMGEIQQAQQNFQQAQIRCGQGDQNACNSLTQLRYAVEDAQRKMDKLSEEEQQAYSELQQRQYTQNTPYNNSGVRFSNPFGGA